jgi:uncharacterized protein (DUF433 family)
MHKEIVERRHGSFYLIGSRIPVARIVWEYRNGEEPGVIQLHYSTLSLEQVNGAIAFYLSNKEEVEKDMAERQREEDDFDKTHPAPPHVKEKLERARQQMLARRALTTGTNGRDRAQACDKLKLDLSMQNEFVERRHGSFYLIRSRVPLAHVVSEYRNGEDPEAIRSHYPTLSLDQVNGAIAFYLSNSNEVEEDIAERSREEDEFTKTHPTPPDIKEKFERLRQQMPAR